MPEGSPHAARPAHPAPLEKDQDDKVTVAPILGPIGSLADHAAEYARAGDLEVFPVNPNDKTPLASQYKATTDLEQIATWWTRWPNALIGHRISPDHVILDIDPRHGGNDTWRALKTELGQLPATRAHASGRGDGGGHLWFTNPGINLTITPFDRWAEAKQLGERNGNRWTCGIDLLHRTHRYTILPPSPHPDTGAPYTWIDGHGLHIPPAVMPQLLVDLTTDDTPPAPPTPLREPDPDSIADWYSTHHTWDNLLTRHGWTLRGGDGNTDRARWRHPTATSAFSATIRHSCLFVYTPNTPFEPTAPSDPNGYTLFRAWATLEHQGDMAAAARAARELKDGPRTNGHTTDLSWIPQHVDPDTGETKPRTRALVLTPASQIPLRRVKWCWDERLALGTLGLLAGPEGLGKSTLAYTIAAAVTRGDLNGEHHGTPKAVLVCATEDSWGHTIAPRLHAAGANLNLVYRTEVRLADDIAVGLSLPLDILELEHAARQTDAALLILDPLISRLEGLDTHRDGDVRQALEPLVSIADKTGLAILGLIHHNKSGSLDPLNVIMASKAFTAVARSVHTVIRDPDDETGLRRFFGTPKNNLGRTDLPTLSFVIKPWTYDTDDGEGTTGQLQWGKEYRESIADILARSARDPEEKTALEEAALWLEDYLRDRQMRARAGDVISAGKAAGHSERTVQRARKKLGIETAKSGDKGAWMWSLPNLPKAPTTPQHSQVGALAPSAPPAVQGAKTNQGAKGMSPRVRVAPWNEPTRPRRLTDPCLECGAEAGNPCDSAHTGNLSRAHTVTTYRCGRCHNVIDAPGLCGGCDTNPGTLPTLNGNDAF